MAVRGYSRCRNTFPSDTFDLGRSIPDFGQMLNRLGPDGLGMTCQEHRIRESVSVGMEGRVAADLAGLARVHSGRLSHRRSDVNVGLVDGKLLIRTSDWM